MKKAVTAFFMAWGMFWIVPCPCRRWDESLYPGMVLCLPGVGLLVGGVWYLIARLLALAGGLGLFGAAVLTAVPYIPTGFIHLDGYMDCADAILSRRDRETRLKILKDSHVGSFAVIALGMLLLTCFSLWAEAAPLRETARLLFLPAVSRACAAAAVLSLRPLETSGYARMFGAGVPKPFRTAAWAGMALLILLPAALWGVSGLFAPAAALGAWLTIGMARKNLGGMSGDISGAAITIGEACGLAALAFL